MIFLCSSYNRLLSVKEELEQKYLHLSQVYESESKTKYQYLQQVEELSAEVRELRRELSRFRRQHHLLRTKSIAEDDTEEIRKIKKVQSLCRGWLYRQRWKRIVEEYIRYDTCCACFAFPEEEKLVRTALRNKKAIK